jgi:hypothetical protein
MQMFRVSTPDHAVACDRTKLSRSELGTWFARNADAQPNRVAFHNCVVSGPVGFRFIHPKFFSLRVAAVRNNAGPATRFVPPAAATAVTPDLHPVSVVRYSETDGCLTRTLPYRAT